MKLLTLNYLVVNFHNLSG